MKLKLRKSLTLEAMEAWDRDRRVALALIHHANQSTPGGFNPRGRRKSRADALLSGLILVGCLLIILIEVKL